MPRTVVPSSTEEELTVFEEDESEEELSGFFEEELPLPLEEELSLPLEEELTFEDELPGVFEEELTTAVPLYQAPSLHS